MDFKNMRWHDYIVLLVFFGVAAYYIVPFIGALFRVSEDESGLTTIGLIITAPIVIVAAYAVIRIIIGKK